MLSCYKLSLKFVPAVFKFIYPVAFHPFVIVLPEYSVDFFPDSLGAFFNLKRRHLAICL